MKCRFGIYVDEIRPNSITDGRLKKWDRILVVNDQTIEDFCIEKVGGIMKRLKTHKNVFLCVSRKLESFETQPIAGASRTQKITSEHGAMASGPTKIAFEPKPMEILKREEESQTDSSDSESDIDESDDSDSDSMASGPSEVAFEPKELASGPSDEASSPIKLSVRLPKVSCKLDFINDPFLAPLNKQYEPKVLASGSQNVASEANPMASELQAVKSKPKDLASGSQNEASEPNSMASGLKAVESKPKDLSSGSQNKT